MYGRGFDSLLLRRTTYREKNQPGRAGGMMAALSIVVMMLTGVVPMAEFALPAIAGLFLVPIVVEIGWGAAWLTYGAVSILSILIAPNKECALYYILFLGCYPLIKSLLETRKNRVLEWF